MSEHFADRLLAAIEKMNAPACVGLDPDVSKFPDALRSSVHTSGDLRGPALLAAVRVFSKGVLNAVAPYVPAVKINIAYFERLGSAGLSLYEEAVSEAARLGLLVIGDVKRADIEHSSQMYAEAHLGASIKATAENQSTPAPSDAEASGARRGFHVDAITINPYFGIDGVKPFIDTAAANHRGLFVLVQTSNPSAATVQGLQLADGRSVAEHVAGLVREWGARPELVGGRGYSLVGAVVSPHDITMAMKLRETMPQSLFLVPGFGAQGRTQEEVTRCFKADGTGAIVNASRSVIYAFAQAAYGERRGDDWTACVAAAARDFVSQVRAIAGR